MQAAPLSLCLSAPWSKVFPDLLFFCPFLPFLRYFSCFSPIKFFLRFLPPSCCLLFDFPLQDFASFHFLILFSSFTFLLPCLLCRCTAPLCTIQCLSPSGLVSTFGETASLMLSPWELAADNIRSGSRSPRRRGRNNCKGTAQCCIMLSGKGNYIIEQGHKSW